MTDSRGKQASRILGVLVCVAALGCGDGEGPGPGSGSDPEARLDLPALILSNPSISRGLASTGSRAALADPVVYASLPPGSVPDGDLALFTNMTTGAGATVVVVAGGFDPVPVPQAPATRCSSESSLCATRPSASSMPRRHRAVRRESCARTPWGAAPMCH